MSQDVKLLPLPQPDNDVIVDGDGNEAFFEFFTEEQMEAYARANMEPLIAENERLRGAVEKVCADHKQVCRDYESLQEILGGKLSTVQARAERLAEALRWIASDDTAKGCDDGMQEVEAIKQRAHAALDQEGGND